MSELISGKEALIALANGEKIQYQLPTKKDWVDIDDHCNIGVFNTSVIKLRLKPRTISINGIEVPECGKDYKYGNAMYILNSLEIGEYCMVVLDKADEVPAYWWRTESEIKQVVEALRSVFKTQ